MRYQIDQSGKIEQTNKNTVLCLSNDHWDSVLIKAKIKRQIQEIFRRNGQIRNYVLFTFCAGLSLLLKKNKRSVNDRRMLKRRLFFRLREAYTSPVRHPLGQEKD